MNLKQCDNFNYFADRYAAQYLYEKERKEFKDWISTEHFLLSTVKTRVWV